MSDLAIRERSELHVDHSGATSDEHLVHLWLRNYANAGTVRGYGRDAEEFLGLIRELGARGLQDVTVVHVQSALERMQYDSRDPERIVKQATFRRRVYAVRSLFSFAHRTGYIRFNVMVTIRPPKLEDHLAERTLTLEELHRLFAAAGGGNNELLIRFLYTSGARVSEAAKLRCRHLHERENGRLQITIHGKGEKTRHVLLGPRISAVLRDLVSEDPNELLLAFLAPRARSAYEKAPKSTPEQRRRAELRYLAARVRAAWRIVSRVAKRAGLWQSVSPHWMRHAHASHTATHHKVALHVIQQTLGHASPVTTGRYLHTRPEDSSALALED